MAHGKWRKQARPILATLLKRIMQSIIYKPKHGFESKRLKSLRAVIWYDMNVRVWSFLHVCDLSHVHGGPQFHPKDFCRICTEFYSGEISGWAQTLGSMLTVTHPFGDHARSRFGFREWVLLFCAANMTPWTKFGKEMEDDLLSYANKMSNAVVDSSGWSGRSFQAKREQSVIEKLTVTLS